jgi:hypothetical protein
MPVIPTLRKQKQEFKASLSYIKIPCLKKERIKSNSVCED